MTTIPQRSAHSFDINPITTTTTTAGDTTFRIWSTMYIYSHNQPAPTPAATRQLHPHSADEPRHPQQVQQPQRQQAATDDTRLLSTIGSFSLLVHSVTGVFWDHDVPCSELDAPDLDIAYIVFFLGVSGSVHVSRDRPGMVP